MSLNLFGEKFVSYEREPSFVFTIPGWGDFGFLPLPILFWIQLAALLFLISIVNVVLAVIVYHYVIRQQNGYMTAIIMAYGVVIPVALLSPFRFLKLLDIRNTALTIGLGGPQLLMFLRCLEAINGTCPAFATISLRNFVLYFLAPIQFNFDPSTQQVIPTNKAELLHKFWKVVSLFLQGVAAFSVLIPISYLPFPERNTGSVSDLFYWGHLMNNYVAGYLTGVCIEGGSLLVALLMSLLTGYSTMELNDNPLTASLSLSEFWGQRWNRMVAGLLKRAVFKPFRRHSSRALAAAATFLASGLIHEYVLLLIAVKAIMVNDARPHSIRFGNQFKFFIWNAAVLVMEGVMKETRFTKWISKNLPKPLITALVLLTVLPISHWFTDEYRDSGFYTDYAQGYPMIIKLPGN